jgi:hypothetical protein
VEKNKRRSARLAIFFALLFIVSASYAVTAAIAGTDSAPVAVVGTGISALGFIVNSVKWYKKHQRLQTYYSLMGVVDRCVSAHSRALTRKRAHTYTQDDYGNPKPAKWHKEIDYFIRSVIAPQLIGPELNLLLIYRDSVEYVIEAKIIALEGEDCGFDPSMTPLEFEHLCAELLRHSGWIAEVTKGSGDQGSDVIATKDDIRLILQCKLHRHPVGNKAVQEASAARTHERADYAAVVSNSRFTPAAQQLAATNEIFLLHYADLRQINDILHDQRPSIED